MTTHVRQFSVQQGSELVKLVIESSRVTGDCSLTILQDTTNLTDIGVWESIDQHLFCSDVSPCSMENLRKTLFLYLPQAQQPDITGYLTELHQSGQNAVLSPGMF
jgi:hypothetical protein